MAVAEGARPTTQTSKPYPPAALGWYSTVLLALLYWLSILDRTVISLLVDPIKADIGITDVQFGMLHGLAFAVTFSVFGLLAGAMADKYNRRVIIFASVSIWSIATAACGLAKNFTHLLLARVGVGAGEAGLNPCATSMITDLFPPRRLTLALAVYALGASVGAGCAFLFGGMLIDYIYGLDGVVLPVVGEVAPWQAVFLIIGVPGVAISLLSFSMPEPARRGVRTAGQGDTGTRGYAALWRFMRSRPRFFSYHYAGFGMASTAFAGAAAWYPAHMGRTFGWSGTEIGLGMGAAMIGGGILGKFLCGFCVDALFQRGHKDAQFLWYALCMLVALPFGVIGTTSDSPWVFLSCISVFMMLLSPLNAVYVSSLNLTTPNELRGAGVALYGATIGLIALSVGPILIAAFSDHLYGGNAIGYGLATVMGIFLPLGAVTLLAGRPSMRDAVTAAEEWQDN